MSDFMAKTHQIRFRLGLRPMQTPLVELTRSPRPLAGLREPTSKGRVGRGRKRTELKGKGGNGWELGKGREDKKCCPISSKLSPPLGARIGDELPINCHRKLPILNCDAHSYL